MVESIKPKKFAPKYQLSVLCKEQNLSEDREEPSCLLNINSSDGCVFAPSYDCPTQCLSLPESKHCIAELKSWRGNIHFLSSFFLLSGITSTPHGN